MPVWCGYYENLVGLCYEDSWLEVALLNRATHHIHHGNVKSSCDFPLSVRTQQSQAVCKLLILMLCLYTVMCTEESETLGENSIISLILQKRKLSHREVMKLAGWYNQWRPIYRTEGILIPSPVLWTTATCSPVVTDASSAWTSV